MYRLLNHALLSVVVLVLCKRDHTVVIGIEVFEPWEHGWVGFGMLLEVLSLVLFEFQSGYLVVAVDIGFAEFVRQLLDRGCLDVILELGVVEFEVGNILEVSLVESLLALSGFAFRLFDGTPRVELRAQKPGGGADGEVFYERRSAGCATRRCRTEHVFKRSIRYVDVADDKMLRMR